jgi:squalene-hopene/tetraprenyl-beta-curcumene cyclase
MIQPMRLLADQLNEARSFSLDALLRARTPGGWWEGELSSSALSTATAIFALHLGRESNVLRADQRRLSDLSDLIDAGLRWLVRNQNEDGGWGDTTLSKSNISTTALCWAALSADARQIVSSQTMEAAERWLTQQAGGLTPQYLAPAIIARYGRDKTFSVPILTMCALAGKLGDGRAGWKAIAQLPFELAAFPQRWFKWLRLPVVSYALPALIAIGLVRHRLGQSFNPLSAGARLLATRRALDLLTRIQPASGGFLEATPLTSFVVMSLVGAGEADHGVVRKGIEFLIRSARPDGSWPIDTNLATWVTTLAINALPIDALEDSHRESIRQWLLGQQYRTEHPYTLADAGGWAWTDLSGGVPDADDTAGALLALARIGPIDDRAKSAADAGVRWLLGLQNRDGGIPTFCRGWGKLPFDRSSPDLTAHAIRAWLAWRPHLGIKLESAIARAVDYLMREQKPDGSWVPLWFGNQHAPDDINPTYGTARVLKIAAPLADANGFDTRASSAAFGRAVAFLLQIQNEDGGWGGAAHTPSSIEETALAIEALAGLPAEIQVNCQTALERGVQWLVEQINSGRGADLSPIGFYFAKLWYFEKLYPIIFSVAALQAYEQHR